VPTPEVTGRDADLSALGRRSIDRLRERIDDLDTFDPLTRLQILRHQTIAAGPARGVDDESVPKTEAVQPVQLDAFDDVVDVDRDGDEPG
jgi:hypothetical protein